MGGDNQRNVATIIAHCAGVKASPGRPITGVAGSVVAVGPADVDDVADEGPADVDDVAEVEAAAAEEAFELVADDVDVAANGGVAAASAVFGEKSPQPTCRRQALRRHGCGRGGRGGRAFGAGGGVAVRLELSESDIFSLRLLISNSYGIQSL